MPTDALLAKLIGAFVAEAGEHCERVTREALALERPAAPDEMARRYEVLCRGLHSLKGSSAMIGLEELADLAHRLEDLVAPWRSALSPIAPGEADALLGALDVFMQRLRVRAEGQPPDDAVLARALAEIDALVGAAQPGPAPQAAAAEPAPSPERSEPEPEEDGSWRVGTKQVIALMRDVERLREVRLRLDERRREVDRALAEVPEAAAGTRLRVRLGALGRALGADSQEASDLIASLEDGIKAICTLPVRTLVGALERVVRDACRKESKEGRLSIVGAEISLDRRVLESIKNPLVHLLRNAVDHGLEQPEAREAVGKHREGALVLRLDKQANVLFVEVSDDGAGIDLERVQKVAIERGLVTAEAALRLSPADVHRLLFSSGFSTKREVTDTSGRGVGLDVVKAQVEALEGRVEVDSRRGQGTRFVLILPAELGSSPVLQVRVGEHAFGLPMVSVETIVRSRRDRRRVTGARVQLEHDDKLVPLVDLGDLVGLRHPIAPEDGMPVLIVQAGGHRVGLLVDEVVGDDDLVIRPLPREVRDVPAYQGAATLARGELLLILRPDWLTDDARRAPPSAAERRRRALVVDDSLTIRALHRAMLEAGGFEVHAASGGQQALDQVRGASYDVVVCDVSMEGMSGLELVRVLRGRPETRTLPVVLVSAHDSEADRARGLDAGADAFLSKKDCAAGRLLSEALAILAQKSRG